MTDKCACSNPPPPPSLPSPACICAQSGGGEEGWGLGEWCLGDALAFD